MKIRWSLVASLLLVGFLLHACSSEEISDGGKDAEGQSLTDSDSDSPAAPAVPLVRRPMIRRRIVRKKLVNGEDKNATNVSVSMSVSEGDKDNNTESEKGALRLPLFARTRSSFFNRTRPTFMTTPVGIPTTAETMETPNSSFKLKMRPRLPFGRIRTTANSITEEEEEGKREILKTSAATASTAKPFLRKKLFKPRVTPTQVSSTSTTTTEANLDDDVVDDEEEDVDEALTAEEVEEEEVAAAEKAADSEVESTASKPVIATETRRTSSTSKNSSMIIIPVPPAQRKPYHPVIMQVTKTPPTPESLPETKVVTYKLNKMFVPMGIYGKVLPKSAKTSAEDAELASRHTVVSTPLPFLLSGQEDGKKKSKPSGTTSSKSDKSLSPSAHFRTPSPEIKVKGHRSKEVVEDTMTSADSSRDYASAVAYAKSQREHHVKQLRQWEAMMQKLKEKHRKNIVDTISLTYDYKPTMDQVSLTTEKVNPGDISITTERAPFFDPRRRPQWGQRPTDSPTGPKHEVAVPSSVHHSSPTKSIFQAITSAASSLPGMIHDGFTSLTGYPSPFEDDTFGAHSSAVKTVIHPQSPTPGPGPGPSAGPASAATETLEFFRKRPYLLQQGRGGKGGSGSGFVQPEYSSGFKPVSAPFHLASQYYASTTVKPPSALSGLSALAGGITSTTPSTIEAYFAEQDNEILKEAWRGPTTPRSPKHFTMSDLASWRAATSGLGVGTRKHPFSGFGVTSTTPRPSYIVSSTTPISFTAQWQDFNKKYTKGEIDEAKERIFSLFSNPEPKSAFDSIMYMRAPAESKHSQAERSGGAFDDLMKMFKMGFSFGAGQKDAHANAQPQPPLSYNAGQYGDSTRSETTVDGWKPLARPGSPAFNFGGLKPTPTPLYPGLGAAGSHFSSSVKPFLPKSTYRDYYNPTKSHYSATKVPHFALNSVPTPADFAAHVAGGSHYDGSAKRPGAGPDFFPLSGKPEFDFSYAKPGLSDQLVLSPSAHFRSTTVRPVILGSDVYSPNAFSAMRHQYQDDPAIEIIPSSVFFKQKGNMADIAAIIKPPDLSSDLVKAALPPQIASVPQLSFPTQQLIQNPHSFTSLSQLQNYFATAQPQPTPMIALHHHPAQFMYLSNGQIVHQSGAPVAATAAPYQHQHAAMLQALRSSSQGSAAKGPKDDLGFTQYNLPAGLDPDIASLIKTELEKDDVPEEYRQDFLKAKEEEKGKRTHSHVRYSNQPQGAGSSTRVTVLKPHESKRPATSRAQAAKDSKSRGTASSTSNRRSDSPLGYTPKPEVKFHKPVPITPTMLTPAKGKPIRASPVPRYVVELARKLKNEKDVQGIVRVSTKRERGPPVEYLYPVRG